MPQRSRKCGKVRYGILLAIIIGGNSSCATAGQGKSTLLAPSPLSASSLLYLGSFGSDDGAMLIREKLRAELISRRRWRVTEDSSRADVILTGSASNVGGQVRGTTDYAGTAVLRLVSNATKETIWLFEYERTYLLVGSVSSRVAEQAANALEAIPRQSP